MKKSASSGKFNEVLLFSDSISHADMLYFSGVFVPDPFIALSSRGRKIAVVSQLEFNRVKRESRLDEVLALEELLPAAREKPGGSMGFPASLIVHLARTLGIRRFKVGKDFPCGLAFKLLQAGIKLDVSEGMLFPEREFKTDEESRMIRKGNAASSAGFRKVEQILRQAEIRKGYLYHEGKRLTSERLQEEIAVACFHHGAVSATTIAAGGDQACDPHCPGSGPLRANAFIVVDIFPRVSKTGYFGDMTRTYLKGRPSAAQRKLYQAVFDAHHWALDQYRGGKSASRIYQAVKDQFEGKGFPTRREKGRMVGFIHGLGHGVGLEVHEPPRVNSSALRLRKGQVITVEPGLYYPGMGGVRIEDMVRIRPGAPEVLSSHPYHWLFQ